MMDWSAISNMIIKAADNMNRGVENASEAGEGNNGVSYSSVDTGSEHNSSGGGYQKPGEQDTSSTASVASSLGKLGKDALSNVGKGDEGEGDKASGASATSASSALSNINGGGLTKGGITSDERLKRIFGDDEDAINAFAKLDSIKFEYTDKAKEVHPGEENGVDNDQHYGIKAQDLEKNPYTTAVVSEDPNGYKQIDPAELTSANTAVIAEICKRLLIIEKVLGIKVV